MFQLTIRWNPQCYKHLELNKIICSYYRSMAGKQHPHFTVEIITIKTQFWWKTSIQTLLYHVWNPTGSCITWNMRHKCFAQNTRSVWVIWPELIAITGRTMSPQPRWLHEGTTNNTEEAKIQDIRLSGNNQPVVKVRYHIIIRTRAKSSHQHRNPSLCTFFRRHKMNKVRTITHVPKMTELFNMWLSH